MKGIELPFSATFRSVCLVIVPASSSFLTYHLNDYFDAINNYDTWYPSGD